MTTAKVRETDRWGKVTAHTPAAKMVGRAVNPGYRAGLNFLSPSDYSGWGRRYSRNLVRSIVRTATGPYDPSAYPERTSPKGASLMKIVALVLAGGEGTRLYPLTAEHAKPALPFA